jgi:hypothetical protein
MKKGRKQQTTGKFRDSFNVESQNVYSSKLENLVNMDKFLGNFDQPKLNQEDINHLNRCMTISEIEEAIKSLPNKKNPGSVGFLAEFHQTFKEELIPHSLKFSMK